VRTSARAGGACREKMIRVAGSAEDAIRRRSRVNGIRYSLHYGEFSTSSMIPTTLIKVRPRALRDDMSHQNSYFKRNKDLAEYLCPLSCLHGKDVRVMIVQHCS